MKKIRKPLILFAFATTAICALGLAAKIATNDAIPTFATYTNHDGDTYYNGISDSLSGTDLLSALQSLNSSKRHSTVGYSGMGVDPSGQFKYTDYDPNSVQYDSNGQPYGTKLITFYSGKSATSGMNREHVWPKSHGGNSVESDIHMPRPTLNAENGSRGNSFYVEGKCHSSNGWDPAMEDFGLVSYRGDSARIILYCVVANKSLSLLEADSHPTSNSNRDNMMGRLSHLLKWNLENPVLDRERNRNEGAEYLQGNRNPFIDHPEYACKIWGNSNDATKKICASVPPTPTKTLTDLSVSGTPSKKDYIVGEAFNSNGLTVKAEFSDESESNVTSSVTWSTLKLGDTSVTGTYTYGGVSMKVVVNGISVSAPEKTLSSLSKSGTLEKTNYYSDEEFDPSGLTIYANFSDGSKEDVTSSISWSDLVKGSSSVTGSYVYKSTSKSITISGLSVTDRPQERVLSSLSQSGTLLKTNYIEGDDFDPSGLTIYANFSDGSKEDITSSVSWGNLVKGSTTVTGTYTYNSISKPIVVGGISVSGRPQERVLDSLSQSGTLLKTNYIEGDDFDPSGLTITANYSDGTSANVTNKILWQSLEVGLTSITGTYSEGSVSKTVVVEGITVSRKVIDVEFVKISDCIKEQVVGNQVLLDVSVIPENADDKALNFESSDESIATVSNDGLVKFISEGSVEITVSSSNGKTDSVMFTVANKPIEFISITDMFLNYTSFTLEKGANKQLFANISPENATNKKVYWSSNDELIAKVNDNGLVTAFGGGEAVITATTEDGGFTATCRVTVNAPKPTLAEIAVMRAPYKTIYNPKDQFDCAGLVVEAHYADGNNIDITDACALSTPDMSTEGEKEIEVSYVVDGKAYNTKFVISVVSSPVVSLNISKFPAKTHYFVSEHFSPIGLIVNAVCQNNSIISNVTSRAQFLYNFEKSPSVTVVVGTVSVSFSITLETGSITDQHKAADFTYVFDDKLNKVSKENVTLAQWTILEYNFNKLDENAKKVLKDTSSKQNSGEVNAAEDVSLNLRNCVAKYDEIYLAHSADGFNDFMNRSPKAETSPVNWPLIIGIAAGVILLIVLIIVISVTASKKKNKKHA